MFSIDISLPEISIPEIEKIDPELQGVERWVKTVGLYGQGTANPLRLLIAIVFALGTAIGVAAMFAYMDFVERAGNWCNDLRWAWLKSKVDAALEVYAKEFPERVEAALETGNCGEAQLRFRGLFPQVYGFQLDQYVAQRLEQYRKFDAVDKLEVERFISGVAAYSWDSYKFQARRRWPKCNPDVLDQVVAEIVVRLKLLETDDDSEVLG